MSDGMFPPAELYEAEQAKQRVGLREDSPELIKARAERAAAFAAEAARRREATPRYKERPTEYIERTPQMTEEAQLRYLKQTAPIRASARTQETEFAAEQQAAAEQGLRDKFELEAFGVI